MACYDGTHTMLKAKNRKKKFIVACRSSQCVIPIAAESVIFVLTMSYYS